MTDPSLNRVIDKVAAAERLDLDDGMRLHASHDIFTIGRLADSVRRRMHGNVTYYNINRHINYSNICVLSCKFCSFYRKAKDDGAYTFTIEQICEQAAQAAAAGATELHIVGGLHPKLKFDWYLQMLQALKAAFPQIHLKAFTAVEIVHFTRIARMPIREVLEHLRSAGLGSLPGGGAEVFDERVHEETFRGKIGEAKWMDVHREAHALGIRSNATMLYGHVESPEQRIMHLIKLRQLQDKSLSQRNASFQTIIPLSFVPQGSALSQLPGPTGLLDLKMLAIARLMLDNFPHVKAFWIMLGIELSQLALAFGVDDLDGTVVWYDITKRNGNTHQEITTADLKRMICAAGGQPVERDTLYETVVRDAAGARGVTN